jgi:hypothetical protein
MIYAEMFEARAKRDAKEENRKECKGKGSSTAIARTNLKPWAGQLLLCSWSVAAYCSLLTTTSTDEVSLEE